MGTTPPGLPDPPEDPEDWSDEQWLEWLEATAATDDHDRSGRGDPGISSGRVRGPRSVLGTAMLGIRDAIYGRPDDEVVIVAEGPGEPPNDDGFVVRLDPEHPERSEVVLPPHHSPAPKPLET